MKKTTLSIGIFFLAVSVASMIFVPRIIDAGAYSQAEDLCKSVEIGEAIASLETKAAQARAEMAVTLNAQGVSHYQVWFSGFLGNASSCEIFASDGVVLSKYAERHQW